MFNVQVYCVIGANDCVLIIREHYGTTNETEYQKGLQDTHVVYILIETLTLARALKLCLLSCFFSRVSVCLWGCHSYKTLRQDVFT